MSAFLLKRSIFGFDEYTETASIGSYAPQTEHLSPIRSRKAETPPQSASENARSLPAPDISIDACRTGGARII